MDFLDVGQIVNTHGVRGEVRITPWCDSAEYLAGFDTLYVDERPLRLQSSRAHKGSLLALFEGIDNINEAMRLKGRVVRVPRELAVPPEGSYFIADLIGLEVQDAATGEAIGKITDVLTLPANDVYVVGGAREYMIPAVSAFIKETNLEGGYISVRMQEGLASDEN